MHFNRELHNMFNEFGSHLALSDIGTGNIILSLEICNLKKIVFNIKIFIVTFKNG